MTTDKEIFESLRRKQKQTRKIGRPRIDRERVWRYLVLGYSTGEIARMMRISPRTVRKIRKEMPEDYMNISVLEDFDEAFRQIMGFDFLQYLKSQTNDKRVMFNLHDMMRNVWRKMIKILIGKMSNR